MKFLPFLFFAATALVACKKDTDAPAIDFGPNGGITVRDVNNRPQGITDPTDWTLDYNWNQQEQGLFRALGLNLDTAPIGTVSNMSAYPNPVGAGQTIFHFNCPRAITCSFVIVDANYRVVMPLQTSGVTTQSLSIALDVSGNTFEKGRIYRLYYVLRDNDFLYYKGHGDIKIGM